MLSFLLCHFATTTSSSLIWLEGVIYRQYVRKAAILQRPTFAIAELLRLSGEKIVGV